MNIEIVNNEYIPLQKALYARTQGKKEDSIKH